MVSLETQEEDAPRRVLCFKSMSWLGQIRTHHRDESWSASLWQTFSVSCVGATEPVLTELSFSTWDCRKFQIDMLGDHLCTCTTHSGTKKTHDWSVNQFPDLWLTTHKVKTHQVLGSEVSDVGTSSWSDASRMRGVQCLWCLTSVVTDKIRKYRADYDKKKNPPNVISFMPAIASTSGSLHSDFVRLLLLQAHRETHRCFAVSGVQIV
jgi:hypothetical protein